MQPGHAREQRGARVPDSSHPAAGQSLRGELCTCSQCPGEALLWCSGVTRVVWKDVNCGEHPSGSFLSFLESGLNWESLAVDPGSAEEATLHNLGGVRPEVGIVAEQMLCLRKMVRRAPFGSKV